MDGEISVFGIVAQPTRVPLEFHCEASLLLRDDGNVGIPFQRKQGNRVAKGLRLRSAGEIGVPLEWGRVCWKTAGVA